MLDASSIYLCSCYERELLISNEGARYGDRDVYRAKVLDSSMATPLYFCHTENYLVYMKVFIWKSCMEILPRVSGEL